MARRLTSPPTEGKVEGCGRWRMRPGESSHVCRLRNGSAEQFTDAGAGALNKPTEVIGLVSLVTLASSVLWMLDPRNALHR